MGKGMAGGVIVLRPAAGPAAPAGVIAGNTCLYGATGGRFYAAGGVGERFAVRNSAARAVVESTGDHCCEYMTGGVVVVLGRIGRNPCAGMTGGTAYFLSEEPLDWLERHESVAAAPLGEAGLAELTALLREHADLTGSPVALALLEDETGLGDRFVRVQARRVAHDAAPEVCEGAGARTSASRRRMRRRPLSPDRACSGRQPLVRGAWCVGPARA